MGKHAAIGMEIDAPHGALVEERRGQRLEPARLPPRDRHKEIGAAAA